MAVEIILHKIEIVKSGGRFGKLWLDKVGLKWQDKNSRRTGSLTWNELDEMMRKRAK
jgi:hypothetical protein